MLDIYHIRFCFFISPQIQMYMNASGNENIRPVFKCILKWTVRAFPPKIILQLRKNLKLLHLNSEYFFEVYSKTCFFFF